MAENELGLSWLMQMPRGKREVMFHIPCTCRPVLPGFHCIGCKSLSVAVCVLVIRTLRFKLLVVFLFIRCRTQKKRQFVSLCCVFIGKSLKLSLTVHTVRAAFTVYSVPTHSIQYTIRFDFFSSEIKRIDRKV